MRGDLAALEIPFEPWTPVEGAALRHEDFASSTDRRPSSGRPPSPSQPCPGETYKHGWVHTDPGPLNPKVSGAPLEDGFEEHREEEAEDQARGGGAFVAVAVRLGDDLVR